MNIRYFAFLSQARLEDYRSQDETFGNRNRARYHALKSAKQWTWSPPESCTSTTFRLISVWPIRKARTTNWMESPANEQNSNAVASSPAHVWLRYPPQEILIVGSSLIARSLFRFIVSTPPTDLHPSTMWCNTRADRGFASIARISPADKI